MRDRLSASALALWALFALCALTLPAATLADEKSKEARKLFVETHKCNMCHGVAAVEIEAKTKSEKMKGGDLSGYRSEHDFETLASYARKEKDLEGKQHKKGFKGSDEELQAILDWLGSLEAQE